MDADGKKYPIRKIGPNFGLNEAAQFFLDGLIQDGLRFFGAASGMGYIKGACSRLIGIDLYHQVFIFDQDVADFFSSAVLQHLGPAADPILFFASDLGLDLVDLRIKTLEVLGQKMLEDAVLGNPLGDQCDAHGKSVGAGN